MLPPTHHIKQVRLTTTMTVDTGKQKLYFHRYCSVNQCYLVIDLIVFCHPLNLQLIYAAGGIGVGLVTLKSASI